MRHHPIALTVIAAAVGTAAIAAAPSNTLQTAIAAKSRTPDNVSRDKYRHPAQTLGFFGVKPTDTVVELIPGGGWYTEILAPYVAQHGQYWAAGGWDKGLNGVKALEAKNKAAYGKIKLAAFPAAAGQPSVPDGSADVVLTFRNIHNMRFAGADKTAANFADMYRMLKPGGTLGIVEHRLPEGRDAASEVKSGYMKTSSVIGFAENAGFKLAGKSNVNANPKDTANWAEGVWTLPPTYQLKQVDRAKYTAIGESDRMTLKFVKPK